MIQKAVPGYTELFGPPAPAHEELLRKVAPGSGILYCIAINNELYADFGFDENQARILIQALSAFTLEQRITITTCLLRLGVQRNDGAIGEIFYKPYLMALLVEELNRNGASPINDIPRDGQFELMLAYFLTIEKENSENRVLFDRAMAHKNQPDWEYRLLWLPTLRQYHLNEWVSPLMEFFKLFCLLKYAFDNWRDHLRQYISAFGVKTIGKFAGSYKSLFDAAAMTLPDQPLKKFIQIGDPQKAKHLQHLAINTLLGTKKIAWPDLKKKPLFQLPGGSYLIIDQNFLHKHIFRGPYFDLQKTKNANGAAISKEYSIDVSSNVLEKLAFRAIMTKLYEGNGCFKFDEGADKKSGVPDCYHRENSTVFLIESKAYIFPDSITNEPDYDEFRKYLNERFVETEDSAKGVGQLAKNIKTLREGGYSFDRLDMAKEGKLTVYPILVHNDFQFSLPGINDYLNRILRTRLEPYIHEKLDIRPLTMMNLDWLFDLAMRKGTLGKLKQMIDVYHGIIADRTSELNRRPATGDDFVRSKASFDEMYQFAFVNELPNVAENEMGIIDLLNFAGLTQEIIEIEV